MLKDFKDLSHYAKFSLKCIFNLHYLHYNKLSFFENLLDLSKYFLFYYFDNCIKFNFDNLF